MCAMYLNLSPDFQSLSHLLEFRFVVYHSSFEFHKMADTVDFVLSISFCYILVYFLFLLSLFLVVL